MTLDDLVAAVGSAASMFAGDLPEPVRVSRSRDRRHGDFTSAVLLRAHAPAGVAAAVAAELAGRPGIAGVRVAGPGFLNITLDDRALTATVGDGPPLVLDPPGTLIASVGGPAARYAWARHGAGAPIDPGPWTRANDANPFYVVQYAAVTAADIRRWALDGPAVEIPRELTVDLAMFPWHTPDPAEVTRALERVAAGFTAISIDPRRTPLPAADATRAVLTGGLGRLGIAAAERI